MYYGRTDDLLLHSIFGSPQPRRRKKTPIAVSEERKRVFKAKRKRDKIAKKSRKANR